LAHPIQDIASQKDQACSGRIEGGPQEGRELAEKDDLCDATILLDRGRLEFYLGITWEPQSVSRIYPAWQPRPEGLLPLPQQNATFGKV
jgi:hypothetical protein